MLHRYMAGGAHGGQVVCELDTAIGILQAWQGAAAVQQDQQQQVQDSEALQRDQEQQGKPPKRQQQQQDWRPADGAEGCSLTVAPCIRSCSSAPEVLVTAHGVQELPLAQQAGLMHGLEPDLFTWPASMGSFGHAAAAGRAAALSAAAAGRQLGKTFATPFHRTPSTMVSDAVEVHRLGVFRFKGNPEPVELVHVTLARLAQRVFPAEAPRGKGARLEALSGRVGAAIVDLPSPSSMGLELLPGHAPSSRSAGKPLRQSKQQQQQQQQEQEQDPVELHWAAGNDAVLGWGKRDAASSVSAACRESEALRR